MKKKIITIIILFLMFLGLFFYSLKTPKETATYKVLKVVEADLFYIDLNKNNLIDDCELIKLKDISALRPIKNDFSIEQAKRLNLNINQYLKTGYLARNWTIKTLENEEVYLDIDRIEYKKDKKYGYSYVFYKNEDLGRILLKQGLAFVYKSPLNKNYQLYQNLSQIKTNANEINELDFVLVNSNSKIFHKPDCEYAQKLNNGELVLKKDAIKNYIPCKVCLDNKNKENFSEYIIPQSLNKYPRSVYKKDGFLELYLINPLEFTKPNKNCTTPICKRIVKEINSSTKSIDLALYGVGSQDEIINALKNAKKRGVLIRAVVDYSRNGDEIYPQTKQFIQEFSAVVDKPGSLMHNKFFIIDNRKVISGSANISSSGTGGYNANSVVVLDSTKIANSYKKEFEQMFSGQFSNKKAENEIVEDNNVSVYFPPKNDVYSKLILNEIRGAKKEIFVSAFYLTDKNLINELILAKKRGVFVLVLMDALCANNFRSNVKMLRDSKIPTIVEDWGGKNHEKTILIDSNTLIMGSCNFSKSGFYKNDENILLIKNKNLVSFYRDYYLYLFNSIDRKFLKLIPRAESLESKNSCFDGIDNNFDGKIDKEDEGCRIQKPNK